MGKALVFHGFKPHFGLFIKDSLLRILLLFVNFCWAFLCFCIFHVFGFIFRKFLSSSLKNSAKIGSEFDGICENPDAGVDERESEDVVSDQTGGSEDANLDYEVKTVSNASTSKYQFYSGNSFCSIVEEPKTMSFTVQEVFVISNNGSANKQDVLKDHETPNKGFPGNYVHIYNVQYADDEIVDGNSSEHTDFCELNGEEDSVKQAKTERSVYSLSYEEQEALSFTQLFFCEKGNTVNVEDRSSSEHEFSGQGFSSMANSDDFWAVIHDFDNFSAKSDSDTEEIMWDNSPDEVLESETSMAMDDKSLNSHGDCMSSSNNTPFDQKSLRLDDTNEDSEHEGSASEFFDLDPHQPDLTTFKAEENTQMDESLESDDLLEKGNSSFDNFNDVYSKDASDEEDDETEVDVLLEQKELIRQMKKEMRRLRSGGGLPTISEESESPRVEDDLRPLKIDDNVGRKERLDEIQTIYKGYLDKMRKLDILCQQTMYAIGLLQLKNQDFHSRDRKISVPLITSLLTQNFWSYKLRKHEADPVEKMIKDCQRDLELVYVGQLCLSWEVLKWQHHKAEELQAYDIDGFHQHSQAAGEFQQFQVLLRWFTEDEMFHPGPRIQHYVKVRCDLPDLLQVPPIRDDPRSEWKGKGEDRTSIQTLKEVVGRSMHTFWEFLRADKYDVHGRTPIGMHGAQFDLEYPSDAELLAEIRSNLQKKEKRLKELGRSGNYIVKKFQKQQDQRLSHKMLLAQVELRLIFRVLHMPKLTTDQLLWCHKKLSKINVSGRKVHLESPFLLFPC